ncbi:MAG: type II secretion system protein [Verrucomicrobiota bacterium]
MNIKNNRLRQPAGFTLVEIMIVVAIIGLLASIAVPSFSKARNESRKTAFISDIRTYSGAAEMYMIETGNYLEDSGSGQIPSGFKDYLRRGDWVGGTPIGGVWDAEDENGIGGFKSCFGVHFNDGKHPGDSYMRDIDEELDDGNLNTGSFRKIADDRYYYILEE